MRLTIDGEGIEVHAELVDVSARGFRACYDAALLPAGTEIRFAHRFFVGRARVAWSSYVSGRAHSGFQIIT